MQNNSSHLKTVYKWGIAQLKICKWFSSDSVRFPLPSLLFIFLQIPSLGLCTVYVFFHLKFFLREKLKETFREGGTEDRAGGRRDKAKQISLAQTRVWASIPESLGRQWRFLRNSDRLRTAA